ncbi:hypothetical protein C2845_PM01G14230 [Panicum miliaceum]|uniref:Uncharacterized protein n=1 Tax=Panicum miliaceum TaxID=4540 RepID=A0A3L6TM51_PANMI|nr:hypothetical protein C2845_PM01G14230 [Panicum miliaceum]
MSPRRPAPTTEDGCHGRKRMADACRASMMRTTVPRVRVGSSPMSLGARGQGGGRHGEAVAATMRGAGRCGGGEGN